MSQEIATVMGGEISVKSGLRHGSEFKVRLPVTTIANEGQLEGLASDIADDESLFLDLEGKTILMVEDHALNAKINSALLVKYTGCKVDCDSTAEAAIHRIKEGYKCDLIFTDINLGEGLTGLEASQFLTGYLKEQCPPIVALTAGVLESERQREFEAGMSAFLGKPFNEKALKRKLKPVFPEVIKAKKIGRDALVARIE